MRPAVNDSAFYAIADETRRGLLEMLVAGDRSASELAEPFASSRSAVSQHLAVLLDAGLVERRREGRRRIYSLQPDGLDEVLDWITRFDAFWDRKLDALGRHLDREAPGGASSGGEGHPSAAGHATGSRERPPVAAGPSTGDRRPPSNDGVSDAP